MNEEEKENKLKKVIMIGLLIVCVLGLIVLVGSFINIFF